MKLAVELEVQDWEYVLKVIAERPFKEVGKLIPVITEQLDKGLKEAQKPA